MSTPVEAVEGVTLGADPEMFVLDANGEFCCADGLIPGDKENPYPVEYGAVQVDGMAAEFNIDPCSTYDEWRRNIRAVQQQLAEMLPNGYSLIGVPTAVFTPDAWKAAPLEAKILGCSPDYNAWEQSTVPPPQDQVGVRFAGGHVHAGFRDPSEPTDSAYYEACMNLVKQLDWFLGPWSLQYDTDVRRREMYGRAGAMRFKDYGVEYRSLSNFWLETDDLLQAVWDRTHTAIRNIQDNFLPNVGEQKLEFANDVLIQSVNSSVPSDALSSAFPFPVQTLESLTNGQA